MVNFGDISATSEQRSLLKKSVFSLRPLASAGMLHIWGTLQQAWLPGVVFIYTLVVLTLNIRAKNESIISLLYTVGLFALLVYPVVAFFLIAAGIVAKKLNSHVRWPAAIFWSWWPFWKFALCCLAVYAGTFIGNYLWYEQFLPYSAAEGMQAYSNIDPLAVQGVRLQDAGIVTFNGTAGVDRSKTGCLKNGATYCVAPITRGVELSLDPSDGKHDLFMAGIDCCTCPGEFRCGAWETPSTSVGGMRVLQKSSNDFFKLASQDWAATYGKTIDHAVFFTWEADPVGTWKEMKKRGNRIFMLSILAAPLFFLAVVLLLNLVLRLLTDWGIAAPLEAPVLNGQMGGNMARRFLPQMSKYDADQRAQLGSGL